MGVNEDELTPHEQADIRARLITGAGRIRPVGRHRGAWVAVAVAVALVAAIAGGVGVGATLSAPPVTGPASPIPTPASSESPAATAEPAPTAEPVSRGVMPFAGRCVNVLTDAEASGVAGQRMHRVDRRWESGAQAAAGSVDCLWISTDEYIGATVNVYASPDGLVTAAVHDSTETGCRQIEDTRTQCDVSGSRDGVWLLLRVQGYADRVSLQGAQQAWDAAAGRLPQFPAPQAATRTAQWWGEPDCQAFIDTLEPSALGFTQVAQGEHAMDTAAARAHPGGIARAAIGGSDCVVTLSRTTPDASDVHSVLHLTALPGAAVSFDSVEAAEAGRMAQVQGAVSARWVPGGDRFEGGPDVLAVSDGVNVLLISPSSNMESAETQFVADVAAAFLDYLG